MLRFSFGISIVVHLGSARSKLHFIAKAQSRGSLDNHKNVPLCVVDVYSKNALAIAPWNADRILPHGSARSRIEVNKTFCDYYIIDSSSACYKCADDESMVSTMRLHLSNEMQNQMSHGRARFRSSK